MYFGFRIDERQYQPGDELPESRVWVDNVVTDETVNGTCALSPAHKNWRKYARQYYGQYLLFIVGDAIEYGEDDGEIIIRNARVVSCVANPFR